MADETREYKRRSAVLNLITAVICSFGAGIWLCNGTQGINDWSMAAPCLATLLLITVLNSAIVTINLLAQSTPSERGE